MRKAEIRLLSEQDWATWKEIRLEALQRHPDAFCGSYEEEAVWDEQAFKKSMSNNDIFGAFIQNQIVGCIGFSIYEAIKMKHRGLMFSLYITPEHRAQSLGNQLVETVIEYARSKVLQLHCGVNPNNQGALNLYLKHGFVIYGKDSRYMKVKDEFYDMHYLVLKLH